MDLDDELRELAEGQHGLITRRQAALAGDGDKLVDRRLRAGRWERVTRNVYRMPGSVPTWHQSLLAAVLAASPAAVASHLSAAALWRLPGFAPGPLEVTRPRGRSRSLRVGRLRETLFLPGTHVGTVDAVPVTRPCRTIFDLCGVLDPRRAERALDNALAMKLTTLPRLHRVLAEAGAQGRGGTIVLRRLLAVRAEDFVPPESELEALLLSVLARAGLPEPARQRRLGGDDAPVGRVDFAYPDAGLVIEADSHRHHSSWLDREADHRRDAALAAAGWRVLRITWDQLAHRPHEAVAAVRGALARAA